MYISTDIMRIRLTESRLRNIIRESIDGILNEGTSTIRDDYVYIIYDFMRECYDAGYGWEIFDDLRWNNVMIVGGPYVEMTPAVEEKVMELQRREYGEANENVMRRSLFESQGVVERGYDQFAEYLWNRCINCDVEPNERGEIKFSIPADEWDIFNVYNLSTNTVEVCISDSIKNKKTVSASFGYWPMRPTIFISRGLIESGRENFITKVMHELTHSVNKLANLADKGEASGRMCPKVRRRYAKVHSLPGGIQYMFTPTEMNARLTEAYYWLKNNKDYYIDLANDNNNSQYLANTIFNDINKITLYSKMKKFVDIVSNEEYGQESIRMYDKDTPKGTSVLDHLSLGNSKGFNDLQSFSRHKENISGYMQETCEQFRNRINKMIYKFMTDFGLV